MKTILYCILLLCGGAVCAQSRAKPNVIIVLTDDQGYGDFSCLGNPVLKTPFIDRFYNESIRFDNFHVSPLCTPTRGQLMSGLDALHNKASNVLTGRGIMRRDIVTMPEVFAANGYSTGLFGKWHLGDTYPDRPMDRGFQKADWFKGWGLLSEIEFDNDYYRTRYLDGVVEKQSEQYCTDLWFNLGMEWMGEMAAKKQPFFTYLSLNAAHGPFQGPKKNTDQYRDKTPDEATANFFGMIANIDENMQRLDDWLTSKNLKENTIVIFMTDNGGTAGVKIYNAGMRGQKASNYDGGHRAACFVQWPAGQLGKPRTIHAPTTIQDWLPSFIDLLGFSLKKKQAFDGISLKTLLRNQSSPATDRSLVVQYTGEEEIQGTVMPRKYDGCVVFNDWRLVGDTALFDLAKDPGQQKNVLSEFQPVYQKMHAYYEQWWSKLAPQLPGILPLYVGYREESPVILNSNNWSGKGVNTQWGVATGLGPKRGGTLLLQASAGGKYKIELSRWPFHLARPLDAKGITAGVGGTPVREGKSLPIVSGALILDGATAITRDALPGATSIVIETGLKAGANRLQAWFKDKDGQDICGAYYVRIQKL